MPLVLSSRLSEMWNRARWYLLAGFVIAADQITKQAALAQLAYASPVAVVPGFFNLTLLFNTGAAFSLLDSASGWQRWFFIGLAGVVSIGIAVWLARIERARVWMPTALALILGGALGNLADRVTLGYVVDFIQLYYQDWYWPAFNLADSAICLGAGMLIVYGGDTSAEKNLTQSQS
ncbi:MAG: signal peptidase II [Pseudomonadota bacterium]